MSRDRKVRGRPDRIEEGRGGATIVDLKTANIEDGEVPLAYAEQLQLYAWLWNEVTGSWPAAAIIELLDRKQLSVDLDPAACEAVAAQAVEVLNQFNTLLASRADFKVLANPGEEQCRYCRFRGGCPAFLHLADSSWASFRVTIGGRLLEDSGEVEGRGRCLTVAVEAGTAPIEATQVRIRGVFDGSKIQPGSFVVADGVLPEVAPHDYWADWDSLTWIWDSNPVEG